MTSRRDVLKRLGGGALALAAGRMGIAGAATPARARGAPAIDGAGGTGLLWYEDDAAATRTELEAIRASGLSAIVLTIAPSGRFWLDDAAFEQTKATLAKWDAIIARHPEHLLAVHTAADLERARRDSRLGLVYTFQGTASLGEDIDRIALFCARGVRCGRLMRERRNLSRASPAPIRQAMPPTPRWIGIAPRASGCARRRSSPRWRPGRPKPARSSAAPR